jgi:ABC-type transport system substrate-binding protein
LVAHDDYWGPKAPAKSITFKAVPEIAARIAGLKTGEFYIITEIPPDQLKSIEEAKNCSVVGGPIPNIRSVNFDTTNPILASNDLRNSSIRRTATKVHHFTCIPRPGVLFQEVHSVVKPCREHWNSN